MSQIERIGVSLDKKLLSMFDELIANHGYQNRSEAIRDLIRNRLSEQELAKPSARAVAAILLVYDHHLMRLSQKLVDIQHQHLLQVISSIHVHLDHSNCLEIVILKGKTNQIRNTADKMAALKGVKLARLNLMSTGQKLT